MEKKLNNNLEKNHEWPKSNTAKIAGTAMLIAALTGLGLSDAEAQTLVNKKQYESILENAKLSQEDIGEDMASFFFGGGIEKWIQWEIEKQNNKHDQSTNQNFSVFKEDAIDDKNRDTILSKEMIKNHIRNIIDSMTTKDIAKFYIAFHNYEVGGTNLVGKEKWSGTYIHSGWNYAEFPVDLNVNYLQKNKNIPYTKAEQEKLLKEFEDIFEKELSIAKSKAKNYRKSVKTEEYESADLIAFEEARQKIAQQLYKKYAIPMIDRAFEEYYGTKNDATNSKKKK